MFSIFDLDGCIADDRRRRPLLTQGYDAYHADLINDPAVHHDAVACHAERGPIIFLTARPDKYREQTREWLLRNYPCLKENNFALRMRAEGDLRGSVELKSDAVISIGIQHIDFAYDDRPDVVEAYLALGIAAEVRSLPVDAADILGEMAATYAERNTVYRDNYLRVAPVIKALWPEGVPSELVTLDRWHLFELMIVKLTRFATTGLTHEDSIHDAAVYAALIESDLRRN